MYALGVRRDFIARHWLADGDGGPESLPNSHHYVLELELEAPDLDIHGYLVDIVDAERQLSEVIGHFREQMLNDLPEFAGLNPSLENFARIMAGLLDERLASAPLRTLRVRLWESDTAWASYTIPRTAS